MNETRWYVHDSFGLKTLHEQNKISFYETQGDHLEVSLAQLLEWVDNHFKADHNGLRTFASLNHN
jgi:hypothetical protein